MTDDAGDRRQIICENPECAEILFDQPVIDSSLVEDPQRSRKKQRGAVVLDAEPEEPRKRFLTATELREVSTKAEEGQQQSLAKQLVQVCLDKAKLAAKEGKTTVDYMVHDGSPHFAANVIRQACKEIKGLGYVTKKKPIPEEGAICLTIKW